MVHVDCAVKHDNDDVYLCWTGCWSPVCVTGSKPSPRCGHTLTAVDENRAILFGGYDGHKHLNDLWLFDGEKKVIHNFDCVISTDRMLRQL